MMTVLISFFFFFGAGCHLLLRDMLPLCCAEATIHVYDAAMMPAMLPPRLCAMPCHYATLLRHAIRHDTC